MIRVAALLTLSCGFAFGQSGTALPPTPPACLSGPVTKGTLTITCTAVDTTGSLVATATATQNGVLAALPYLLFIKAVSTDPDVIGVRMTVNYAITYPSGSTDQLSQAGTLGTPAPQSSPVIAAPLFMSWTYLFAPGLAPSSLSIQVQELKASSSQSF